MKENNNEPLEKIIAKAIEERYGGNDDSHEAENGLADRSVYHIDDSLYYSQSQANSAYTAAQHRIDDKNDLTDAAHKNAHSRTAPRPASHKQSDLSGSDKTKRHSESEKKSGGKSKKTAAKKKTTKQAKKIKDKRNDRYSADNRKRKSAAGKGKTKMNDYESELYDSEIDVEQEPPRKKRHPIKTLFKLIILLIVVLFAAYSAIVLHYINMVESQPTGDRVAAPANMFDSKGVRNILLIGADGRSDSDRGRADSVILLSIDWKDRTITLTSFMRDSYVDIPGHGYNKLNAAYRWGGAELLMDTLQQNFRVPIDDYVCVDFRSFSDIVDAVGGIELTVTTDEAVAMQAPMAEVNKLTGLPKGTDYIYEGGKYLMNGNQALAYARIRYVGRSDFQRTERQREVIQKIFEKAKGLGLSELNTFAATCAESVTTNLTKKDMYILSLQMIYFATFDIEELRIPTDDGYTGATIDGQSVLQIDFDKNIAEIEKQLYD